jgi:hypothetical protein
MVGMQHGWERQNQGIEKLKYDKESTYHDGEQMEKACYGATLGS